MTMWETEADKYWKEKEKAKKRAELAKKVAAGKSHLVRRCGSTQKFTDVCDRMKGLLTLVVVILLFKWGNREAPPLVKIRNETVPLDVLNTIQQDCQRRAIDACNKKCR